MVLVKGGRVEFQFFRPSAREVHVVGDFTGWRAGEVLMEKSDQGYWRATVRLPGGCFRFRYVADGQWFTDYAAFGIEPGPYGPVGILYVPPGPQPESEETSCLPEKSHTN
jgi:1,4-alpha-glucan branching enzyme